MLPFILDRMSKLGYAIFTNGDYNLNIFGIRSENSKAGKFDDLLGVCYKENGRWVTKTWVVTTDPGNYYLEDEDEWLNDGGVAILVPSQYRRAYGVAKHRGNYDALCQINGTVKVYRDTDLDDMLDFDPNSIEEGWFGINIHASSSTPYEGNADNTNNAINAWSAGCQVFARELDFREFMRLVKISESIYGKAFTYTLLTEAQAY